MTRLRRHALVAFAAMCLALTANAQTYPTKPVRVIVPYPAGGSTDIFARLVSRQPQVALGQPFIVDNRGGGVTPYKINDFAVVAGVAKTPNVLAVNADLPAHNLTQFIEYGKANEGKLNNATLGPGSVVHLLAERFALASGVKFFHVPYRGSGLALQDLLGNQVQTFFDAVTTSAPHFRSGKIRGLAMTGEERSPTAPDVRTFKELGYPSMVSYVWYAYLAPAGTPQPIIDRLSAAVQSALATPEMRAKLADQGALPIVGSPEEFERYMKDDLAQWAAVVKATGVQVD